MRLSSRSSHSLIGLVVVLSVVFLSSCQSQPASNAPEKNATSEAERSSSAQENQTSASASDTLPLLPIMVQLEVDMNGLSGGIWREDYEQMKASADGIANHPKILKSQLNTIKEILGEKEFKKFVQDDMLVHNKAIEIKKEAERKDFPAVTRTYLELTKGCISCHQKHRGKIRDSDKWR